MRKNRWRGWIFLIALSLGVVVWWGLGWYLAPRPLYTLRYQHPQNFNGGMGPNVAWMDRWSFEVVPIDKEERYFSFQRAQLPRIDFVTTEIHDLKTGALVTKYEESTHDRTISPDLRFHQAGRAEPNGEVYVVTAETTTGLFEFSLLKWNALTNQREVVRTWSAQTPVIPSHDGRILIEKNVLSPLLPQTLQPLSWSNYFPSLLFWNQANAINHLGITLLRVLTIPDLEVHGTIAVPSPKGLSEYLLTTDGRWLLFGSAEIPSDYQPKGDIHDPALIDEILKDRERRLLKPFGIAVYDLLSGQSLQQVADHPGSSFGLQELGPGLFHVFLRHYPNPLIAKELERKRQREISENVEDLIRPLRELPTAYFHLPSGKWLDLEDHDVCAAVPAPDSSSNRIRALTITNHGRILAVWEIDQQGILKQIQNVTDDFINQPRLIPRSNQCFFVRSDNFPGWLREQALKYNILPEFFRPERCQLVIMDYCKNRELANLRVGPREFSTTQISPKGNYLIVEHHNDKDHEVVVFSLPVADYSPWWARCAGLLTFIIIWFAFRRLARS